MSNEGHPMKAVSVVLCALGMGCIWFGFGGSLQASVGAGGVVLFLLSTRLLADVDDPKDTP